MYARRVSRDHAKAIGLFTEGLAARLRSGDVAVRWNDIGGTRQRHIVTVARSPLGPVRGRSVSTYTVVPNEGGPIVFDSNFEDADLLFARIDGIVQQAAHRAALSALAAGGSVPFGAVSLSPHGVRVSAGTFRGRTCVRFASKAARYGSWRRAVS